MSNILKSDQSISQYAHFKSTFCLYITKMTRIIYTRKRDVEVHKWHTMVRLEKQSVLDQSTDKPFSLSLQ